MDYQHHIHNSSAVLRQQLDQILRRQRILGIPVIVQGLFLAAVAGQLRQQLRLARFYGLGLLIEDTLSALLVLLVDLRLQFIHLFLQGLLIHSQLQALQLLLGSLQRQHLLFIGDLGPLHVQRGQRGVVGQQLVALLDGLALLHIDLADLLGVGQEDLLHLVGGHHAAGLGGIAPVVAHAEIGHGVYIHIAPLGIAGQRQAAPHNAAGRNHTGGDQQAPLYRFIHRFLLRSARRP